MISQIIFDTALWFLPVTVITFATSLLIVATRKRHIGRTAKGHAGLEIQSMHSVPTPRIGGMALLPGFALAGYLSFESTGHLFGLTLLAAIPVFAAGLMEDVGVGASPKQRLLAAMFSSMIMIMLTGQTINSGVGPGIDYLLSFFTISAAFTIFATAAVCHAFNLIDGMNGLAMSISIIAALALGAIALQFDDIPMAMMAGGIAAATVGVLILNYPFGKLFLGDAGAYTLGFLIACTGVLLIARNPELSRWSVLLTVFWPFIDTSAAVLRRIIKRAPVGEPDKMHFHHVVMRAIKSNLRNHVSHRFANPLTTLTLFPLVVMPPLLGVLTSHSAPWSLFFLAAGIAGYFGTKILLIRHFRKVGRLSSLKRKNRQPRQKNCEV